MPAAAGGEQGELLRAGLLNVCRAPGSPEEPQPLLPCSPSGAGAGSASPSPAPAHV